MHTNNENFRYHTLNISFRKTLPDGRAIVNTCILYSQAGKEQVFGTKFTMLEFPDNGVASTGRQIQKLSCYGSVCVSA